MPANDFGEVGNLARFRPPIRYHSDQRRHAAGLNIATFRRD
jgi:hypothetical protein